MKKEGPLELFEFEKPDVLGNWKPLPIPTDITKEGIYVGTSGYYYDDWLGKFNPPKIPKKTAKFLDDNQRKDQDRFQIYQKYFPFIEVNQTFYKEPQLRTFIDLERCSQRRSIFTIKVHRNISHPKALDPKKGMELMKAHVQAVSPLAEAGKFYSFLIQLDDHNDRSLEKLDYLLAVSEVAIRKRMDVHIEYRHKSWHQHYVLQQMKDNGVGICNTEIPTVEHAFPLKAYATTDKGYVRYSGRSIENWYSKKKTMTAKERIQQRNLRYDYLYNQKEIKERIEGQLTLLKKTNVVAVAYNNHYNIQAVKNALENINQLKRKLISE